MRKSNPTAVPALCLWLVRAAGRIVPAGEREAWTLEGLYQAEQYWAFLLERGERTPAMWTKLLRFHRRLFAESLQMRFPDGGPGTALRRRARSPVALFVFTAVFIACLSLASGGLRALRTLYRPLPYLESRQLVSCYQVHFASMSLGVQARYVRPWQEKSETLAGLEAYAVRRLQVAAAGEAVEPVEGARVTPGFFDLLGANPVLGRRFRSEDSAGEPPVLLSWDLWRRRFGGDPAAVGRSILVDGRPARIVGVLPESFWFRSPELQIWTLLPSLDKPDPALRLVNAVGRLKPDRTLEQARRELQQVAFASSRFRGGAFRVVALDRSQRPSLQLPLLIFLAGSLCAAGIALVQIGRIVFKGDEPALAAAKYWLFFAAKVVLLLGMATAVEAELAALNALNLRPSKFLVGLLIDWVAVLAALLLMRWAMLDQSRRCPVCLRRLGVPVTSGSWSSSFLEPPSTEMLCDQGHGALRIADSQTVFGEIRRWIAMDDSWRELLASEHKTR